MKKYIAIITVVLSVIAATFTSCGGNDAATNNGSDTGVYGTNRSITDTADGMFDTNDGPDSGGIVENDVYSTDGFADDSMGGETGTAADITGGADMSYDASGAANNTTLNY